MINLWKLDCTNYPPIVVGMIWAIETSRHLFALSIFAAATFSTTKQSLAPQGFPGLRSRKSHPCLWSSKALLHHQFQWQRSCRILTQAAGGTLNQSVSSFCSSVGLNFRETIHGFDPQFFLARKASHISHTTNRAPKWPCSRKISFH